MKVKQTKQNEQKIQIKKRKQKKRGFTLVELVVVILIIAILATATFLGGATVIKQSRKTKVQNNLRNYTSYMEDMFYNHPDYATTAITDVKATTDKYLTSDMQFTATGLKSTDCKLKDSWGNAYTIQYDKVAG